MSAFKKCSFYPPYLVSDNPVHRDVLDDAVEHGFHSFLAASFFGHINVIKILMSEGNLDANFKGITFIGPNYALKIAIRRNHLDIVKLLLEQGATVEKIDSRFITTRSPIVEAAQCDNRAALETIFNELRIRSDRLELHGQKKEEFVKNIKLQCEEACLEACELGQPAAVDVLLRQGWVDVNLSIEDLRILSHTALHLHVTTVQILVKHGARMENESDCGIVAAMYESRELERKEQCRILEGIVLYLLRSGCNVANGGIHACVVWYMANLESSRELNPIDRQREEIKKLLLKNCYDPMKC